DINGWPRIGRPTSVRDVCDQAAAVIRGNLDVLKIARKTDALYLPSVRYAFFSALAILFCWATRRRIVFRFHDLLGVGSAGLRVLTWFVTDFVHYTRFGYLAVTASNPFLKECKNHVIPPVVQSVRSTRR